MVSHLFCRSLPLETKSLVGDELLAHREDSESDGDAVLMVSSGVFSVANSAKSLHKDDAYS